MEWALGFSECGNGQEAELINLEGGLRTVGVESLLEVGIPETQASKRVVFEGEMVDLALADGTAYLDAFGLRIPSGLEGRHDIFCGTALKGIQFQVPALVLMRAMFKPSKEVFPSMFKPANVDLLSFVDYDEGGPTVMIDDHRCQVRISSKAYGSNQAEPLRWLQTSRSARHCAHQIHLYAMSGSLGMRMPRARVKLILHGLLQNRCLFATKAALVAVSVPSCDSISAQSEDFVFNSNFAGGHATPVASADAFQVLARHDGSVLLSDEEWEFVEPILGKGKQGRRVHSPRTILNVILHKLATGTPWRRIDAGSASMTDVTMAFRRWCLDGRMERAVAQLQISRSKGQVNLLSA